MIHKHFKTKAKFNEEYAASRIADSDICFIKDTGEIWTHGVFYAKVEASTTNGNIKINGTETTVYTHPSGTNPHGTTKSDVGLGSVVNTGDSATPVSGGTTKFTTGGAYTELAKKVDKVSGKGLSTNDYTDAEKNKVDNKADIVSLKKEAFDFSKKYLTFEALEAGTFTFTKALSYSLDGGTTWVSLAANTATPNVVVGNEICFKASLTPDSSNYTGIGTFSATGNFNAKGNPMSLLFGDNFVGQTSLSGKDRVFTQLFCNNTKLISAENLSLPATTLANSCYDSMFSGCTSLTKAPELPATTLGDSCYFAMFKGCTSLTIAPELPATTLVSTCYNNMFRDCTALTTAPELPATTLANWCYAAMFRGCISLTTAPELPATTLVNQCYNSMFYGCESLTIAPELPATTLVSNCYNNMFNGCSNLSSIKMLATNISATNCLKDWVNGVAASGTFVKNDSATWDVTGTSGVPTGWTVKNASDVEVVLKGDLKLDANYTESSLSNAALTIEAGDSIQTAISKIHKAILDDEYVTATAVADLYTKIGQIETLLSQI